MKTFQKRIVVLLNALAVLCSMVGCAQKTAETGDTTTTAQETSNTASDNTQTEAPAETAASIDTFSIGISDSYSGATAQYGLEAINGLEMALGHLNANGGFNGATGVKATLYDSKGSTEEAGKSAQKLTQNEHCNAIIASQVSSEVLVVVNV